MRESSASTGRGPAPGDAGGRGPGPDAASGARRPGLAALLSAEMISTSGAAMTALALPWFVLAATGSPARAGLVAAAEWIPMALLGIPSGALVSRLGPRRTMLACDVARAPLVASVPLLHSIGALPFGLLLAIAFAVGAFFPAHIASQRIVLPELLGERGGAVTRANVLLQAANRLPLVIGPASGGALIAVLGASNVLLIDSTTYAISAGLIALRVPERPRPRTAAAPEASGLWAGARCLASDRLLAALTLTYAGLEMAMQAVFISLPILAFTVYGGRPGVAGALLAAWGAGALAGSLPAIGLAHRDGRRVVRGALAVQALPLWLLALDLPPAALGAALALSGLANPVANAPANTIVTMRVPEALRAKSMLAFVTAATAAGGLGLLVAGPAAEALGARAVLSGVAALATGCAIAFAVVTRERLRRAEPSGALPL